MSHRRIVCEITIKEYTYAGDRDIERTLAAGSAETTDPEAGPMLALNKANQIVQAALKMADNGLGGTR